MRLVLVVLAVRYHPLAEAEVEVKPPRLDYLPREPHHHLYLSSRHYLRKPWH
jgi:hypothetical protein